MQYIDYLYYRFDCLGTVIRNYRDFPSSTRCSFDIGKIKINFLMHSYLSFYTVENNIKLLTKGHLFYDSFVKRNRTESGKVIYSKLNF